MAFPRKTKGQEVREAALRRKLGEYSKADLSSLSVVSLARSYGLSLVAAEHIFKSMGGHVGQS